MLDSMVHGFRDRCKLLFTGVASPSVVIYVHVCVVLWYVVEKRDPEGWASHVFQNNTDELPLNYWVAAHWSAAQLQGASNIYLGWYNSAENAFFKKLIFCSILK